MLFAESTFDIESFLIVVGIFQVNRIDKSNARLGGPKLIKDVRFLIHLPFRAPAFVCSTTSALVSPSG